MKKLLTVLALAAAFTTAAAAQTPAAPPAMSKELASLQGTWQLVTVNDQNVADQGAEMALVFDGNKYKQVVNGTVDETGTFNLDPSKKPMSFDLTIIEGDDAGKLQLGIIEINGDVIKGLFAAPGGPTRPADFNSNDGAIFFIAKRVK
jgi:uncharacterized protein (TIGR03067 family)